MKALILENTKFLSKGDVVLVERYNNKNIVVNKELIPFTNVLLLKEELTSQDEAKVKKIVKDVLKLFFWRLYTRNSFVLS